MIKDAIIEALGETELLLPDRVNRGLVANDRVKYYLTLLQSANHHAAETEHSFTSLRTERDAAGVDDASLDRVVEESRPAAGGDVHVPGARQIMRSLLDELALMLQPVRTAAAVAPDLDAAITVYTRRLERLQADAPSGDGDRLPSTAIEALMRGGDAASDSVHQLTMDLHKELNRLQALIADEVIDGAHTYGLAAGDRPLIAAFVAGVGQTSPLKFDHPGLGTTATRVGARLSIQNDIGTTGAHVVVVHVEGTAVTVIYTDVHRRRLVFLQEMLAPFAVEWHDSAAPAGAACTMTVGRFTATAPEELAHFLTFFGSRLTFLIDWNRARRRLARIVRKPDAARVLSLAAENGTGHCAFLRVDGLRLVERAIEAAVPSDARGRRLDDLLGRPDARSFLGAVLGITSKGLRAGRSAVLMQDEIEAELLRHLKPGDRGLIGAAAEHAMYISALAERLRRAFVNGVGVTEDTARTAELAKTWEARADDIVRRWTRISERIGSGRPFSSLFTAADAVADALEEAAFLLTLVPADRARATSAAFDGLPDLVGQSAKEYVRCLDYAAQVGRGRARADVDAFLRAVDRIAAIEHQCDAAERAAEARLVKEASTFRELHVLSRLVQAFESAADALARCAVLVKDHILSAGGVA